MTVCDALLIGTSHTFQVTPNSISVNDFGEYFSCQQPIRVIFGH